MEQRDNAIEIDLNTSEVINNFFDTMNLRKNLKLTKFDEKKMYEKFCEEILNKWSYSVAKDEGRLQNSNSKNGGYDIKHAEATALIRSAGWDLIKQIGRKIISGDFNLTTVSMPIKVMVPFTMLQTIARSFYNFPLYFGLASLCRDPLERFKLVIVGVVSTLHRFIYVLKPMNPILGETYEMVWQDGSKIYLEQTFHHPPITHYLMHGPNNSFKFHGFSNYNSNAGLNSFKVINTGKRFVEFPDGTKIKFDFCYDYYSNTFWGTMRHENLGQINFIDLTNGFECSVKFSSVKKKVSDFFTADIKLRETVVSKGSGSWVSFAEFDGKRYWDIRENLDTKIYDVPKQLPSCSLLRGDRVCLERFDLEQGQKEKERLENLQRKDRKLREGKK